MKNTLLSLGCVLALFELPCKALCAEEPAFQTLTTFDDASAWELESSFSLALKQGPCGTASIEWAKKANAKEKLSALKSRFL